MLLLCGAKGQLKVVFAGGRGQGGEVERRGEEGVDQSTKGQTVTPTGREVVQLYTLKQRREEMI